MPVCASFLQVLSFTRKYSRYSANPITHCTHSRGYECMELYLRSHILLHEVTFNQEQSRINKYPSNSHVCRLLIKPSTCVPDDGLIKSRHIKQLQFSASNTCRFQLPLACRDCGFESLRGMDICVVCCQVEVSCDELITSPEEPYRLWCVVEFELKTSRMSKPWIACDRRGKGGQKFKERVEAGVNKMHLVQNINHWWVFMHTAINIPLS